MFRQLTILMWKHMVVRKRKIINTLLDFFVPLVFFMFFHFSKEQIKPSKFMNDKPVPGEVRPIPNTDIIDLTDIMPPPHWIIYYPETILTNSLMDEVGAKLYLKRLDSFPGHSDRGYYPYSNGSSLDSIAANLQIMEVIIIFHDMGGESWPDHLNYIIRMKGDFGTKSYKSPSQLSKKKPEPHRMYGLKYGTFMRIQWAVDTSYIKLLTGNDIPQSVALQEFPLDEDDDVTTRQMALEIIHAVCKLFYPMSLMLTFAFTMTRLLQDRCSGVQELLLMVGVSHHKQRLSHILNMTPIGILFSIVVTAIMVCPPNPFIQYSAWYLIFVFNLLYFNFVIALAFVCQFVLNDSSYAASVSVLLYVLAGIPGRILQDEEELSRFVVYLSGILPHMPMRWFVAEVIEHELYHKGSDISNMYKSHTLLSASILMSFVYMLIQIAICYILTWYLQHVRPGKYGQALPWNFCFQYWTNKNVVRPGALKDPQADGIAVDSKYFEPAPPNSVVGIKIVNVSKAYGTFRALKNVSLDVLKGEITVLLGHNGAGKTTLMSIITAMTSATEGKVFVNGKDTVLQQTEIRKHVGLCPQHDIFFTDLTVEEHIMLFSLLRGDNMSFKEAKQSSKELADKLGLGDKLPALTSQLSGGMKRRAQLAIALAGGADTLVLDEPTSGLDVETRRELWDLLLALRGDRTVLLSTHYMEEADALGDRMAAIQDGVLVCSATPMYLKNAVGTGYRLTFTTVGAPKEEEITNAITSIIPGASLKEKTINSLIYYLPTTETSKFPEMFAKLEAQRTELEIVSIGLGVATLEEVFIKLCSNVDTTLTEEEVDATAYGQEAAAQKVTGPALYKRQFCVLLKRQARYSYYRKWIFLLLQVMLPLIMIAQTTYTCNTDENDDSNSTQTSLDMDLDIYGDRADRRVMYHVDGPDVTHQDVDTVQQRFPNVKFENAKDVAKELLRTSQKDTFEYSNYLVGVEINETDAKVLYTTTVRHAAPVGLNLLSNMLASHYISWSDGKTITTINDPVTNERQPLNTESPKVDPKTKVNAGFWCYIVQFCVLAICGGSCSLPCKERLTGTRHIHMMSGCPPLLHWLVAISYHAIVCVFTMILPILIIVMLFEEQKTIDQMDYLMVFSLITLLGSMTTVAVGYLMSFMFSERNTSIMLISMVFIFGVISSLFKQVDLLFAVPGKRSKIYYFTWIANIIGPPHTAVVAALSATMDAVTNANCEALKYLCPYIKIGDMSDNKKCCTGQKPRDYLELKEDGAAVGMIILTSQFLVLMTAVILCEKGFFNGLFDRICNRNYKPVPGPEQSESVRAEENYINETIKLPANKIEDAVLAHNLHKVYPSCLTRKKVYACEGVNFSVKKGECFGLLGVNGAGKSTVFKIITAEETATRGNLFVNGYHRKRGNTQYLKTLGYCPQFFGLDLFLTGKANLEVILTLRGYHSAQMEKEVKNWISIVGLEQYAQQLTSGYSGGCLRRMGTAAALCSDAELCLLDEPSAGVDVVARRRVWIAMRKALRRGRSIIITSHSMDEMEALCNRIAIMANGRVRALGSAATLRAEHAKGFATMFKMANINKLDRDHAENLAKFKARLHETFNCTLIDEHVTMLHYHINEVMPLSDLFNKLEAIRKDFPTIIEDYAVSETTLEEVFLSYAAEKRTPVGKPQANSV